jgi:hypothetical protein
MTMFNKDNLLKSLSPEARAAADAHHEKLDALFKKHMDDRNTWKHRCHEIMKDVLEETSETNGFNLLSPRSATFIQLTWSDAVSLRAADKYMQMLYDIAIDEAAMRSVKEGMSPLFVKPSQIDSFIEQFQPSMHDRYDPVEIFACMINPKAEKVRYPYGRDTFMFPTFARRP